MGAFKCMIHLVLFLPVSFTFTQVMFEHDIFTFTQVWLLDTVFGFGTASLRLWEQKTQMAKLFV